MSTKMVQSRLLLVRICLLLWPDLSQGKRCICGVGEDNASALPMQTPHLPSLSRLYTPLESEYSSASSPCMYSDGPVTAVYWSGSVGSWVSRRLHMRGVFGFRCVVCDLSCYRTCDTTCRSFCYVLSMLAFKMSWLTWMNSFWLKLEFVAISEMTWLYRLSDAGLDFIYPIISTWSVNSFFNKVVYVYMLVYNCEYGSWWK